MKQPAAAAAAVARLQQPKTYAILALCEQRKKRIRMNSLISEIRKRFRKIADRETTQIIGKRLSKNTSWRWNRWYETHEFAQQQRRKINSGHD